MAKKPTSEKTSLSAAPKPKKTPAKPAKRAATRKPVTKAPTPVAAAKVATVKAAAKTKPAISVVISDSDIALRAYFIAERRQNLGWDGDEHGDWVEAKRQLEEEASEKGL